MKFDFDEAYKQAQHIACFMAIAQERLWDVPTQSDRLMRDYCDNLCSLVEVSEQIALGLMARLDAVR